jgi:hypothetical protein
MFKKKLLDYQYLNEFIDPGVEKAMKHKKFNKDEIGWYILISRIRIRSGLCGRIRIRPKTGSGPKPDRIRNTGSNANVPTWNR